MSISLMWPGTMAECRRISLAHMVAGTPRQTVLDAYSLLGHDGALLACLVAGWVEASLDGGTNWTALATDPRAGVSLGTIAPGGRAQVDLRVTVPTGATKWRGRSIGLLVGEGV